MLARLDHELVPLRASVDREGTRLRIEGVDAAHDVVARVVGLVEVMGYHARPLSEAEPVARWFTTADVDELSREEASVLAERWARELGSGRVIEDAERVLGPLEDWLLESFRSAARTGEVRMRPIQEEPLRRALTAHEAARVRAWLEDRLGLHDTRPSRMTSC